MAKEILPAFLEGERIDLFPLKRADVEQYIRWLNDPHSMGFLGVHRPLSEEEQKEIVERLLRIPISEGLIVGICLKNPQDLIGSVTLERVDVPGRHAEISLFIGEPEMRGLGYGREALHLMINYAFRTLNLRKVWARYIDPFNQLKSSYESIGFREAGRFKGHRFIDGKWHDEVLMELFRDRYLDRAEKHEKQKKKKKDKSKDKEKK